MCKTRWLFVNLDIFCVSKLNVTGVSIESIYPPMNGKTDRPFRLLNMLVVPQNSFNASRQIHVIWTRLEDCKQGHYWYPDHFVTLLDNYVSLEKQQPIKFSSSPCIDSLDDFPPLPTSVSKKRRIDNKSSSRNMSYIKHDTFTDSLSSSPSSPQRQNKTVHSLSQQNVIDKASQELLVKKSRVRCIKKWS